MATYTFDTNESQEKALFFFATKEGLHNEELFQRIVFGALQPYESSIVESQKQDLFFRYQTASKEKREQVDTILKEDTGKG
jgi:hypothetical protein